MKKNIKNRLLAGFLIVALSNSVPKLVKGAMVIDVLDKVKIELESEFNDEHFYHKKYIEHLKKDGDFIYDSNTVNKEYVRILSRKN